MIRLKEDVRFHIDINFEVGLALSADWMRPPRRHQN
jgi:hypothetical protein